MTAPNAPLDIQALELDAPRAGEALVRVTHCGLCHTDLTETKGIGVYKAPVVLGHEAAGVVAELGGPSDRFAVGDRVVLSMRGPCDDCFYCHKGQPVLCENARGTPGTVPEPRLWRDGQPVTRAFNMGAFADHALVSERQMARVPDGVQSAHAAVCGCAVQTAYGSVRNIAQTDETTTALVIGLGGIGLATVLSLRAHGAMLIAGIDPLEPRRASAKAHGAHVTAPPGDHDALMAATDGRGFDTVYDVVATTETTRTALSLTRPGGHLVLLGVTGQPQPLGFSSIALLMTQKQVSGAFLGNCHPARDLPEILKRVGAGDLPLDRFVTATLPLAEINTAMDLMRRGEGLRTVLTM